MILEKIADKTRERLITIKQEAPLEQVREAALALPKGDFPFERALGGEAISFICEVKKASPSKGIIAEEFPYLDIAKEYEEAGASAISVLTEPEFFLGRNSYLQEIAEHVSIPTLRKDFTVDPYQIYEAKTLGASCVLLICALLDTKTLCEYLEIAHHLGLSAIVEAHTKEEVNSALSAGARIVGVNNRNLHTFEVDIATSGRLRALVPQEVLFISESGIRTAEDIAALDQMGVNGVLIGETLMRAPDKKRELAILMGNYL